MSGTTICATRHHKWPSTVLVDEVWHLGQRKLSAACHDGLRTVDAQHFLANGLLKIADAQHLTNSAEAKGTEDVCRDNAHSSAQASAGVKQASVRVDAKVLLEEEEMQVRVMDKRCREEADVAGARL